MSNNKESESRAKEQVKFMAELIKRVSQPMIITSAERHLLCWNEAFSKLTGYRSKELSDPILAAGLTAPEWHESEARALEKLQRTGKSQTFQKEYIREDGTRVPVEVLIYKFAEDSGGTPQYYIGLITDITERKHLEEELQKSESHYRTLVESAIEGIVVLQDGAIKFTNPVVSVGTGYSVEELQSMSLKELICPDNEKATIESISKPVAPGTLLTVPLVKIRTKTGDVRLIESTITSIVWDDKPANLNLLRDITEQERLEESLAKERQESTTIIDSSPIIVFYKDAKGRFVRVNKAFADALNIPQNEFLGKTVFDFYSAEIARSMTNDDHEVLKSGRPKLNIIEQYESASGMRWVRTDKVPILREDGSAVGLVGFAQDITERKEAEEALKQSEEKYRSVLENMEEAYSEVDLAGNFTFFNSALCTHLGYSREELLGMNYKVYTTPENVDKVFKAYNQVYRTGEPIKLFAIDENKKDGTKMTAEISVSPLKGEMGKTIGFRQVSRDITERVRMESALRQSEEKYRTILNTIEESYYEVDLAGNFTFFNETLKNRLSYSAEEMIGMNYREYTPPEMVDKVFQAYNHVFQTGQAISLFSMEEVRKNGTRVSIENSILPIYNEKGEITGFRGIGRDVTIRLLMEEALRRSEERYRTMMDEMHDDYFEVDLAGNFTFVNDALCRSVGYTTEELTGKNYVVTNADDADRIYKAFHQIFLTGQPIKAFNHGFVRKDGSHGIGELSAFPIKNDKGDIIGFKGVSHDITERKQMEEALSQSEKRYRTILEDMQESYFETDLEGNYTLFNDAQCRQLGYSREEMMGMNYKNITPPDIQKEVFEIYNQIYRTGEPNHLFQAEQMRKDGTRIPVEYSAFPIKNEMGEIVGFRGVGRDISKRMQMEEDLRQSEERYRTVLEEMEEPYYEMDLAGRFTFFNDAMTRRLGYSREELMGMPYKAYTPPEEAKRVRQEFNEVYRTGEPAKLLDRVTIRKDGTRNLSETTVLPLRNDKGEIVGFRGLTRDLSERRKVEEEKKQLEQKAQFASRLASVGELASGVAHEINNPLTGVIGYAHLLLTRKDLSRDVRHDLEIINEGSQRVAAIVKKLLTFARQTKPEQRYVNINELIHNTLELRSYELSANNIKVTLQLTRDIPMTIADPGQLQQVFLNLIINAETEMKQAHDKGRLTIKTERMNGTMRITFKDTGPGIAKENLETIFDPFYTTREVGQGTGLGLSVCHGIITEHNGKIWAESELGKGASFIIEIPLITEEMQINSIEAVIEEPVKVAKAKILVVDDEPVIRQFISQVLGEQGHTVETVDNAATALKMVKAKRYRLILLDIKMPGMSGVELYKQFQKIAPSITKRVVFITGDVMGKRTISFLNKTKALYMMKPFDARELRTVINSILAKK
jgi:PAS domain S-box-containing protein